MTMALSPRLQYLAPNELAALGDFIERLRWRFGDAIKHVWLFGSKVRGDFDEESDIDLLIVADDLTLEFEHMSDHWAVEMDLEHSVVLSNHMIDTERYAQMQAWREPIYNEIQNEGIDLWQLELSPAT